MACEHYDEFISGTECTVPASLISVNYFIAVVASSHLSEFLTMLLLENFYIKSL